MEFSLREYWGDNALAEGEPPAKVWAASPRPVIHALKFRGRTIVVQARLMDDACSWEKSCDVRWGVPAPRHVNGRSTATLGATKDFWAEFYFRMTAALPMQGQALMRRLRI